MTEAIENRDAICIEDSGGFRENLLHMVDHFEANTVLCSYNTIQPSGWYIVVTVVKLFTL